MAAEAAEALLCIHVNVVFSLQVCLPSLMKLSLHGYFRCGLSPRSTSYPQNWKSVMQHEHFGQAAARLPRGHVLLHLAR